MHINHPALRQVYPVHRSIDYPIILLVQHIDPIGHNGPEITQSLAIFRYIKAEYPKILDKRFELNPKQCCLLNQARLRLCEIPKNLYRLYPFLPI